tara:strand:+ start:14074 stop:15039 length:966 start_codon:yes stop_codon:yes gene_type:complete
MTNHKDFRKIKYFCGSMSIEIVDAIIKYYKQKQNVGIISSRRQVDTDCGYVNNWSTSSFHEYIRPISNIVTARDHGGPDQGDSNDNGIESLINDCIFFDLIHIDPWKVCDSIDDGAKFTEELIKKCYKKNNNILFEIGTEENIKKIDPLELDFLISYLKQNLLEDEYDKIIYAVIQSGMKIKNGQNSINFSTSRTKQYLHICKKHNILSKEHNTDYCDPKIFRELFSMGLNCVNLAPQIAKIHSSCMIDELEDDQIDDLFGLCLKTNRWQKWFDEGFNPEENRKALILSCGHYAFYEFGRKIKNTEALNTKLSSFLNIALP